jgi:hypothetical protein
MNPIHLFPLGRGDGNSPRMRCSTRYQRLEEILAAKQRDARKYRAGQRGCRGADSQDEGQEAGMRTRVLF